MASATSGNFTTNLAAGSSAANKYTMTLAYSYSTSEADNKTTLTITGTIKSNNSSYYSYKSSSSNTVQVRYNNSSGTSVLSKSPTTAYDCRNLGSTQIFSYSVDINHDDYGNRVVWVSWFFDGLQSSWNPTGTVTGTITFPKIATTVETFTITYHANGGYGTPPHENYPIGSTVYITSKKPFRSGYSFLGWSTSSDSTTATYSSGSSTSISSATLLYAVWSKNDSQNIYLCSDMKCYSFEFIEGNSIGFGSSGELYASDFTEADIDNLYINATFKAMEFIEGTPN